MVSRGLCGAAALALAIASAGAFAPGAPFVRSPLNPSSYAGVLGTNQVRCVMCSRPYRDSLMVYYE